MISREGAKNLLIFPDRCGHFWQYSGTHAYSDGPLGSPGSAAFGFGLLLGEGRG